MPQVLLLALGAMGAAIAAKLLAREWQRVNDELDQARAKAEPAERSTVPELRRDPVTGVYRANR